MRPGDSYIARDGRLHVAVVANASGDFRVPCSYCRTTHTYNAGRLPATVKSRCSERVIVLVEPDES